MRIKIICAGLLAGSVLATSAAGQTFDLAKATAQIQQTYPNTQIIGSSKPDKDGAVRIFFRGDTQAQPGGYWVATCASAATGVTWFCQVAPMGVAIWW